MKTLWTMVLIFCLAAPVGAQENPAAKLYGDLAVILEKNIDTPDAGVEAVKSYFQNQPDLVGEVRALTRKGVEMMNSYLTDEAPKAGIDSGQSPASDTAVGEGQIPAMTPDEQEGYGTIQKYATALDAFSLKNPIQAIQISGILVEYLLPGDMPVLVPEEGESK